MKIEINIVPKEQTRFPDLYIGDYYYEKHSRGQHVIITAVDSGNSFRDRLTAIHELIEFTLTDHLGKLEEDILAFDQMFDRETKAGLHSEDDEPGDDPRAPYLSEHQFATIVEKLMLNFVNKSTNE